MSDQQSRIESKLEEIRSEMSEMQKALAVYNKQLEIHIEGTVQNRNSINQLHRDLEPVKAHVNQINGGLKMLGTVALVVSMIAGLFKIFGL